jgi:hypothetical protein
MDEPALPPTWNNRLRRPYRPPEARRRHSRRFRVKHSRPKPYQRDRNQQHRIACSDCEQQDTGKRVHAMPNASEYGFGLRSV